MTAFVRSFVRSFVRLFGFVRSCSIRSVFFPVHMPDLGTVAGMVSLGLV